MKNSILSTLNESANILNVFISDESNIQKIASAVEIMVSSLENGGKIIACGNGGSLCDATHFCEELTARFRKNRKALPAVAINDPAFITCAVNDFNPQDVFARYIEAMGKNGDVLLAISTSGNSENVLRASKLAREMGIKIVALTGKSGGKLGEFADVEIRAPFSEYSDRAQEIHIKVIHILVQEIENLLIYKK
ncbi:MAG: SIS domain-containing protein [Verrucomicrobiaceae bacterium]|nr:SIS domain-containing protein [Verrucomicrobiaceae bacterium]